MSLRCSLGFHAWEERWVHTSVSGRDARGRFSTRPVSYIDQFVCARCGRARPA